MIVMIYMFIGRRETVHLSSSIIKCCIAGKCYVFAGHRKNEGVNSMDEVIFQNKFIFYNMNTNVQVKEK